MALTQSWPSVETGRLRLRAPDLSDSALLAALADDRDVARMTTGIPHPYSARQAVAFIGYAQARDAAREALFVVEAADDGLIGLLGFHPNAAGVIEIGYWLGRPFWGRGYMTEAVLAALEWAGTGWGRRYLVSGHFTDNPASGRVLVKAGFLYTGEIQWRFSLARNEAAATRMMIWLA